MNLITMEMSIGEFVVLINYFLKLILNAGLSQHQDQLQQLNTTCQDLHLCLLFLDMATVTVMDQPLFPQSGGF